MFTSSGLIPNFLAIVVFLDAISGSVSGFLLDIKSLTSGSFLSLEIKSDEIVFVGVTEAVDVVEEGVVAVEAGVDAVEDGVLPYE